jgi:hypothetical protein
MPAKRLTSAICSVALAAAGCGSSASRSANTTASPTTTHAATTSVATITTSTPVASIAAEESFTAEVWADNWFSLFVNGKLVGEDSVPITTERSFNAETITFTATYPLTIAMVTKDYKANDTGLEYIGTDRQQMGDGGFIAQIKEKATGTVIAATNGEWRGLVIHQAPTNKDCAKSATPATTCKSVIGIEPSGWTDVGFNDSTWLKATVHTAAAVGPKDGYNTINWDASAAFIWSADLFADNTILWRTTVRR